MGPFPWGGRSPSPPSGAPAGSAQGRWHPRAPKKARGASGGLQVCQARVLRSACSCLRRKRLEIPVKVAGGKAIGPTAAFGAGGGGSPAGTLGGPLAMGENQRGGASRCRTLCARLCLRSPAAVARLMPRNPFARILCKLRGNRLKLQPRVFRKKLERRRCRWLQILGGRVGTGKGRERKSDQQSRRSHKNCSFFCLQVFCKRGILSDARSRPPPARAARLLGRSCTRGDYFGSGAKHRLADGLEMEAPGCATCSQPPLIASPSAAALFARIKT